MTTPCAANPPAPSGYGVWTGPVPKPLSDWCVALLKTVNRYDFGQTWEKSYNGQTVIARLDHHTWHYLPDGRLLTGICWKGLTLYRPSAAGLVESPDVNSDPLASPDAAAADALFDHGPSEGVNWPMVALTGGLVVGAVAAFLLAIKHAGRA